MVIFEALFGCHDILILDTSPIKWRQCPDMTTAVDRDAKPQLKQTNKRKKLLVYYTLEDIIFCNVAVLYLAMCHYLEMLNFVFHLTYFVL